MTSDLRIGNDWSCLLDFSEPRYGYTMVAIGNDQIGFVGGYCHVTSPTNRTITLRTVTVYNLVSKSFWSFEMFEKRCDTAAVVIGNKLLIFGGRDANNHKYLFGLRHSKNNQYLKSCEMHEIHDSSACNSRLLQQMTIGKSSHCATVYDNDKAVILGGITTNRDKLENVCMFNTLDETWTELPPMPTTRHMFAAGCCGRYIIVAGGIIPTPTIRDEEGYFLPDDGDTPEYAYRTVDIMDMETQTWRQVQIMNHARYSHGGTVVGVSPSFFLLLLLEVEVTIVFVRFIHSKLMNGLTCMICPILVTSEMRML